MPCQCCTMQHIRRWAGQRKILLWTLFSIISGIVVGLSLRMTPLSYDAIAWIKIWGELFLRMLKMIILPLIVFCLVVGISGLESGDTGKLAVVTLTYVLTTQLIAVTLGLVLAIGIHPGRVLGDALPTNTDAQTNSYTDVATDFLRNLFPENIIQACLQNVYTNTSTVIKEIQSLNDSDANKTRLVYEESKKLMYRDGMNAMGVLVFSIMLGAGIRAGGATTRPLISFFDALNTAIFKMMDIILIYSPLGIFSLIAAALLEVDNLTSALHSMALFILTVMLGLLLHQLVILPLIYVIITRRNPYTLLLLVLDAVIAAMAPPTSAAALPYLLRDADEKLNIDPRLSKFVLPVCTTINKDGSALFITAALVFVAQTYDVSLGVGQYFVIVFIVSLLSAVIAAVPSSSLLVLLMASSSVGVPVAARIGLLMTVEWLLDRFRTGCNVVSNGYGVFIVAHFCNNIVGETCEDDSEDKKTDEESNDVWEQTPSLRDVGEKAIEID